MPLRIACDLDGTVADLRLALQREAERLFGPDVDVRAAAAVQETLEAGGEGDAQPAGSKGNKKALKRLHSALRVGGKLLLELCNRDFVIRSQPNLVWFEGDGCICMEETKFNYTHSRLEVSRNVMLDDGRQREKQYSLRLYSLHELGDRIAFHVR